MWFKFNANGAVTDDEVNIFPCAARTTQPGACDRPYQHSEDYRESCDTSRSIDTVDHGCTPRFPNLVSLVASMCCCAVSLTLKIPSPAHPVFHLECFLSYKQARDSDIARR